MRGARSSLNLAAEGMALMLAAAGASVVAYFDLPEPERVEAPAPGAAPTDLIEVELIELPNGDGPTCQRAYSSAASKSLVDAQLMEEFIAFVCADRADCAPLAPEVAICIAEERFFGEGHAHAITYIANPFAWVVSGEHQRVFVDAHTGNAVAINYGEDQTGSDLGVALGL